MQHERLYLADILRVADRDARSLVGSDEIAFIGDERAQSVVDFQLSTIEEAVRNDSDGIKRRNPDVRWQETRIMRNFIAHHYIAIDLDDDLGHNDDQHTSLASADC